METMTAKRLRRLLEDIEAQELQRAQSLLLSLYFTALWIEAHIEDPYERLLAKRAALAEYDYQSQSPYDTDYSLL